MATPTSTCLAIGQCLVGDTSLSLKKGAHTPFFFLPTYDIAQYDLYC
jgi:hypothetical protein